MSLLSFLDLENIHYNLLSHMNVARRIWFMQNIWIALMEQLSL